MGENTTIEARASAIPSPTSPWLIVLLVALGAFLLGAVAFLLMRRRDTPVAAEGPIEEGALPPAPTEQVAAPGDATATRPEAPIMEPMPTEGPTSPVEPIEPPPPPGSAVPPEDEPPSSSG